MPQKKNADMDRLVCPYTGRPVDVYFDDNLKEPGWRARGVVDTSLPFFSKEAGEAAFRFRAGRPDAVSLPVCAYTGSPVAFVQRGSLWFAVGDPANPAAVFKDREDLEFLLGSRAGKPRRGRPKKKKPHISVGETLEEHSDPTEGVRVPLDDVREMTEGLL